ncbi:MAG TPA: glycosyl hydrolase 53 family protein [Prolixibacteraceae bacterium]|nr:glycosyl hydrolase 53 family protein [Prolixibacteraceae bacterium]
MKRKTRYIITICAFFIIHAERLGAQSHFIFGADLSYANMMEDCGADFKEDNASKDIYQIFADNGTNLVRVRLWHNPDWQESLTQPKGVKSQYSNFEDVKETITRAKMAGMDVMLGFQFSDFWCDPGRQIIPKAWDGVANNLNVLKDSVYNYVYSTLEQLNKEGLMPEYVKIGNENNSGIMTHKGMNANYEGLTLISNSWSRHAQLYNAAIKAVRDLSGTSNIKPKISLHVADPGKANWFYSNLIANGVNDFDIMGFSYYYAWHGQLPGEAGNLLKNLKNKYPAYEVMIVETGYLWDNRNIDGLGNIITESCPGYEPVSPANQQKFMVDLTRAVQDAGGAGIIFWEPDWVSTPCRSPWGMGSSQEHVAFFDHRNNLNFMKNGGGGWPGATTSGIEEDTLVTVTFQVDMTGMDVSKGVYVVGQMSNWEFVKMTLSSNSIYSTSFELIPGNVFAYYYITTNTWDNYQAYRETVPEACANSDELLNDPTWNSDRAFIVPGHDTVVAHVWASCETFSAVSSIPVTNNLLIYPNPPPDGKLFIENKSKLPVSSISMIHGSGQIQHIQTQSMNENDLIQIDVSPFKKGIYLLLIHCGERIYSQRIILE